MDRLNPAAKDHRVRKMAAARRAAQDASDAKTAQAKSARDLEREIELTARISKQLAAAVARAGKAVTGGKAGTQSLEKAMRAVLTEPGIRTARPYYGGKASIETMRPQAPDTGGVTFHYSVTSTSKSSGVLAAAITGGKRTGTAASHEAYIERPGAAENLHEGNELTADGKALDNQTYTERPGAAEDLPLGLKLASFGNISEDYLERVAFWQKLEQTERTPGKHTIRMRRDLDPDFWARAAAHIGKGNLAPGSIIDVVEGGRSMTHKLSDQQAVELVAFMRFMGLDPNANESEDLKPISISPARGGRVQTRIIAELPHELSPVERLAIAKEYCAKFEELGLPFWAVIHAPDHHNDSRNFHIHIALSERPAKRMPHPETGEAVWDFEVEVEKRDKHWNKWTSRPHQQPRIRDLNAKDWPTKERHRWCEVLNRHLEKARVPKRYDPRSYKAMGITLTPRSRITPKIFAKERKGEATREGLKLAREQWDDLLGIIGRKHATFEEVYSAQSAGLEAYVRQIEACNTPRAKAARDALNRWRELTRELRHHQLEEDSIKYAARQIISRIRLIRPAKWDDLQRGVVAESNRMHNVDAPSHATRINELVTERHKQVKIIDLAALAAQKAVILNSFNEAVHRYALMQQYLNADVEYEAEVGSNRHSAAPTLERTSAIADPVPAMVPPEPSVAPQPPSGPGPDEPSPAAPVDTRLTPERVAKNEAIRQRYLSTPPYSLLDPAPPLKGSPKTHRAAARPAQPTKPTDRLRSDWANGAHQASSSPVPAVVATTPVGDTPSALNPAYAVTHNPTLSEPPPAPRPGGGQVSANTRAETPTLANVALGRQDERRATTATPAVPTSSPPTRPVAPHLLREAPQSRSAQNSAARGPSAGEPASSPSRAASSTPKPVPGAPQVNGEAAPSARPVAAAVQTKPAVPRPEPTRPGVGATAAAGLLRTRSQLQPEIPSPVSKPLSGQIPMPPQEIQVLPIPSEPVEAHEAPSKRRRKKEQAKSVAQPEGEAKAAEERRMLEFRRRQAIARARGGGPER